MDGFARAQGREGEVEVAGAVADAMAGAVEGGERNEQNVRCDLRRLGSGLADPPDALAERLAERPDAERERMAAADHHRQGEARALPGKLAHQRQRVDLAA